MTTSPTKLLPFLAITTIAGAIPALASAQQAGGAGSEIIVTAQRRSEALEKTPVAVSALNAETLEKQAIKSETDLQTAVPGLVVRATTDGGQLNYSIRGQTIDAFTDSQPAVKPYFNEVPVPGISTSSFYDLESVQVLKGPQGTLFGRNVTGGAVLFTPAAPKNEFGGYVVGRAGNYDRYGAEGAVNMPLGTPDAILRVAGSTDRRDGFTRNLLTGERLGKVKRDSVRASLLFAPLDSFENTTVLEYSAVGGGGTPGVVYSTYGLGQTNNGIPLATNGAFLYSPALDFFGAGSWDAYLAAHPGVDPNGLDAYTDAQTARGPYKAALDSRSGQKNRNYFASNTTKWDAADNLTFKNILGYVRSDNTQWGDLDGTPYLIEGSTNINEVKQFTEEFQLLGDFLDGDLSYVAGVFYVNEKKKNFTDVDFFDVSPILPVTSAIYISQLTNESVAGYGQATLQLQRFTGIKGLGITGGMRYTDEKAKIEQLPGGVLFGIPGLSDVSKSSTNKTSWQFGVQEQLNDDLLLYVTARKSFRSGGFNKYALQLPGTAAVGGNAFDPEIAKDIEIGAKYRGELGALPVRANVAAYKQKIENVQRSLYAVNPITSAINGFTANIPEAEVKGVELDAQISPAQWLDLGFNVAYTDAEFTENEAQVFGVTTLYGPYSDSPKWSGSAFVQVTQPMPDQWGTLSVRADAFTQSHFYFGSLNDTTVPETRIPGYTVANLRVGLEDVGGSHISVAGYVKNLFDKEYFVGGQPTGAVLGTNLAVPGDRRTFYAEVRYNF